MRPSFILLVFVAILFSCGKSKNSCDEPKLDCSIVCVAHWSHFDFRLIDKTSGADLIFAPNPRYTASDIKIFYDAARLYPMQHIGFDNNSKTIQLVTARHEMYLEIKGTDIYKLTAEFRAETCCSSRVKTLWQDGQMVCSCCTDTILLPIR